MTPLTCAGLVDPRPIERRDCLQVAELPGYPERTT
jgi:hypothetical protein